MALKNARELKDKTFLNEDSEIYGFELLNIVHAESPFRFSERKVQKQSGGWASIAQQIGYVLFCSDLGDALVPSSSANYLCQHWRKVPPNCDYLSAYVPCVEEVLKTQGRRPGVQSLYEECKHKNGQRCSHLMTYSGFLESSKKVSVPTLGEMCSVGNRGAIIFGKKTKLSKRTIPIEPQVNGKAKGTAKFRSVIHRFLHKKV